MNRPSDTEAILRTIVIPGGGAGWPNSPVTSTLCTRPVRRAGPFYFRWKQASVEALPTVGGALWGGNESGLSTKAG